MDHSQAFDEELQRELQMAFSQGADVAQLFNLITQKIGWVGEDPPRLAVVKHFVEAFGIDLSIFKMTKQASYELIFSSEHGWSVDEWDGEELRVAIQAKMASSDD